jgi:mRNA interferase MazF
MNIALDNETKTQGYVLTADVKVLDIIARNYEYIEDLPDNILFRVLDMINSISEYIPENG